MFFYLCAFVCKNCISVPICFFKTVFFWFENRRYQSLSEVRIRIVELDCVRKKSGRYSTSSGECNYFEKSRAIGVSIANVHSHIIMLAVLKVAKAPGASVR